MELLEFYARCASGLESLLAAELKNIGIKRVRPLKGGVAFFGSLKQAYAVCLWSRVASRVLIVLDRFEAHDAEALYEGTKAIEWESHIGDAATISVHSHGVNEQLRNTQFSAVKVKDAVCDRLRAMRGFRPDVNAKRPSVAIDLALRGDKATLSLDLSGEPLHRRGYRSEGVQSEAPLKETLAAAVVLESGWPEAVARGEIFVDPMCGSGTLAIEAAMIAADMAPGILRDYWGFEGWLGHDAAAWEALLDEADERLGRGLENMPGVYASDIDASVLELAQSNAKRAGLSGCIRFACTDAAALGQAFDLSSSAGVMALNPPYGKRLGTSEDLPDTYTALRQAVDVLGEGWKLGVITSDPGLEGALGMPAMRKSTLYNGKIETVLYLFDASPSKRCTVEIPDPQTGRAIRLAVLEKNSEQFAARLRKVAKERRKKMPKQGVSCYRIYDADLPDYAVAIDLYEGAAQSVGKNYLCISEYQAPKEIDPDKAQRRFDDACAIAPVVLGIPADRVFTKVRRRERGGAQYAESSRPYHATVSEGGYLFELDLGSNLDTGLFLDHRLTRALVKEKAQGTRFLNLFAYTGAVSVYAAGGGAAQTTTVDLSTTYLAWAKRNMEANGFGGKNHLYIRADVKAWIAQATGTAASANSQDAPSSNASKREKSQAAPTPSSYDLIFIDPPTFSNSKSMGDDTWSVQRDHAELLVQASNLLAPGGTMIFSCNLRSFKIDQEALCAAGLAIEDISAQTIPEDFSRNQKIHRCYLITRP